MADDSDRTLELKLPGDVLDGLQAAADARGVPLDSLAKAWLQDRLIHEQENQQGTARQIRKP